MKSYLRPFAFFAPPVLGLCLSSWCVGGVAWAAPPSDQPSTSKAKTAAPAAVQEQVIIPGPLRSFLRMAAISQKAPLEDVLPLLSRNVFMQGYQQGTPTEYLVLLYRYVEQARELQILAGPKSTIRVTNCDDAGTLVQILGYRIREGCGQKTFYLETANPERAFLTIDSGFPLTELELALQEGKPFTYSYPTTAVPVMFHEADWTVLSPARKRTVGNLIEVLVNNPDIARLYWALTKNDTATRTALHQAPGLRVLLPYAAVLDFYGGEISVRSGHVIVPGGRNAEGGWKELVGASPGSPSDFVSHLLATDQGWLAVYFDVLSRVSIEQQRHLTESQRMNKLYEAFRPIDPKQKAVQGVFRRAPGLLVLFTRLEWEPNGQPHVPGDLEVWRQIVRQKSAADAVHGLNKNFDKWGNAEQFLETMTSLAREDNDSGPLQTYLTLCELDSQRPKDRQLSAGTVKQLAEGFPQFNSWYLTFSEFPDLTDASIARFLNVANSIDGISNQTLRGNTLGAFQANVGLWQILARQGEIPAAQQDASWQKMVDPFIKISSSAQLFDATHNSLGAVLEAAGGRADSSQEELVQLLAGPRQETPEGQRVHEELAERIRSVLIDQHLVSLDTLFTLNNGFSTMTPGHPGDAKMLALASELREFEMPRAIFTKNEKIEWAPRVYSTHHAELQVQTDLSKVIKAPGSKAQLDGARGELIPFLRDTLVGLNYAYYEPPGAQMLHNNPLFVRAHDFTGVSMTNPERTWHAPILLGAGMPAGGGAYLMGSLSDLSYALAATEQDFIAPENIQALVWKELVPDLLVSATLPRWWTVTPSELHAAALYQKAGEEILVLAENDATARGQVIDILWDRMAPRRLEQTLQYLTQGEDPTALLPRMLPSETFHLAAEFRKQHPSAASAAGPANQQLDALVKQNPNEVNAVRIAKDFGVPHPTLARTNSSELLNIKPFPFFGGYSSRLFGESWESGNLYWARLADEMGYSPVILNRLIPDLTRRMSSKIFATELEDWPSMLRAMRETGDEVRRGRIVFPAAVNTTSLDRTVKDGTAQTVKDGTAQ
jgi:hypothetical protein